MDRLIQQDSAPAGRTKPAGEAQVVGACTLAVGGVGDVGAGGVVVAAVGRGYKTQELRVQLLLRMGSVVEAVDRSNAVDRSPAVEVDKD